jgi:hypothetical protein
MLKNNKRRREPPEKLREMQLNIKRRMMKMIMMKEMIPSHLIMELSQSLELNNRMLFRFKKEHQDLT